MRLLPRRSNTVRPGQPLRRKRSNLAIEPLESRYLLAVFTVTTTDDAASGSLRQAILDSNDTPGRDRIEFKITSGVQTIRPQSPLPTVRDEVDIDATTQPGYKGMPLIEIEGRSAGAAAIGLSLANPRVDFNGSSVRGLVINRFDIGIRIMAWRCVVQGNFIGTDVTGTQALGNRRGILLYKIFSSLADDNLIGGDEPGAGNLISGNREQGIFAVADQGTVMSRNVVQGNLIGTDITGLKPLGNGGTGIQLPNNNSLQIGGLEPGAGNLVAFNGSSGVNIPSGLVLGNVVYGNAGTGIWVNSSNGNLVQGNWVVGNGGDGITLVRSAVNNRSFIGGTNEGEANFVGYNGGSGIVVDRGARNTLSGNSVIGNVGPGIELRNGGNNDQPAPHVAGAFAIGNRLFVGGWLFSPLQQRFAVEFFASPDCDDSGYGEGEYFLGSRETETDKDGLAVFVEALDFDIPAGWAVTATATDALGNTSAFSSCATVQDAGGAPGGGLGDVLATLLAGEVRVGKKTASVSAPA